ncbi:hypothetical protein [Archangium violaceum]|uniref:Uncharacterized protein n=1 Tax=Archangium violaceum Cb vi76 TaxID=1406225 RepID=A0A084SWS3_9BACT|nr:hypothetical protein [Archangium violaceum]KFA92908.1 hypothetical protein Q664_12340 [Archangium violaceum Cb vi76]
MVRLISDQGRAIVLCGTGTKRAEYAVIEVPGKSAAGKALGLDKDTFFYATQLRSVRLDHLRVRHGHCPPALFLQVRILVEGALSILTPTEQTKDLAEDALPLPSAQVPGDEKKS